MVVTALQVKELRELTGAGMLDCKKALEATNGDIEKAKDFLREKGLAKAQSKASRIAAEGLCVFASKANEGYLFELNSETDFVAKNEEFINLTKEIGELLLKNKVKDTEEALKLATKDKRTVADKIAGLTAKIGEKITLRRVLNVKKTKEQSFNVYSHQEGRIISLVVLNKENAQVGLDIAMQVAALRPQYLKPADIPAEIVEKEKHILTEQVVKEGKPANVAEKIVLGRINKFYEEVCLLNQAYIKDGNLKVEQYLKNNNCEVVSYYRYQVGEGIEKKVCDFAKEVQEQMGK